MNIITGYRGEAHITADQIRDQNQGCFGDGSYILDVGSKLAATAVSATSVQLADGIISHQGCTASIPYGTTEAVTIGNGTQGMQRIDLIVARYTKDAGTGVEDMELAVIQGTPAASNPSTPSYNQGSIHAGDSPVDMPLFQVVLDGISIDEIVQVAPGLKTQAETDEEISQISDNLTCQVKAFSASGYSIAAGSSHGFSANDFSVSAPPGYTPVALAYFSTGLETCLCYSVNARATGTGRMMSVKNVGNSSATVTPAISILYVKSDIYQSSN